MSIAFDFDGVIVDTRSENIEILNRLAHKYGYDEMNHDSYTAMSRHNFYQYWQMLLGGKADDFFADIHATMRPPADILPGMKEILQVHTPVIISSNVTHVIRDTLKQHDITLDILGGDYDQSKVRKLNQVKKTPAIFVTDTPGDVQEGKIAGYVCIAVTWGFATLDMIQESQPDHIVHTPQELHALLLKLRGLEHEIELFR